MVVQLFSEGFLFGPARIRHSYASPPDSSPGRNLPHKQLVGASKRQPYRALPDPNKESFAPGSRDFR